MHVSKLIAPSLPTPQRVGIDGEYVHERMDEVLSRGFGIGRGINLEINYRVGQVS